MGPTEIADAGNLASLLQQHLATPQKILYRQYTAGAWQDIDALTLATLASRWQRFYREQGLRAGDRIALCLKNTVSWAAADLGALASGLVVVPLYVDDNAENAAWCAADAGAKLVIAETRRMADAMAQTGLGSARVLPLREADRRSPIQRS